MAEHELQSSDVKISGYRDLAQIGRGASSVVYRGFDPELNRWVAIKVLLTDNPDDPARRRFKREGEITANLGKHPHIVQVLSTGFTSDQCPYVVMEYFEEGSIGDRLRTKGAFDVTETVVIGDKIADAVAAAHKAGILHRDIKPQNILLSEYGPALADFGIARTSTNLEWSMSLDQLTPMHSPPETLSGGTSTAQSDIYSLGSTLYTMLAGRAPFAGAIGESPLRYQVRVLQDPVPPIPRADLGPGLPEVLNRALAKNPADRFESAVQFRDALRRVYHASIKSDPAETETGTSTTHFQLVPPSSVDVNPFDDSFTQSRNVDPLGTDAPTQDPFKLGTPQQARLEVEASEPEQSRDRVGDAPSEGAGLSGAGTYPDVVPLIEFAPRSGSDEAELTRTREGGRHRLVEDPNQKGPAKRVTAQRTLLAIGALIILIAIGLGISNALTHKPAGAKHSVSTPPLVQPNGRDKPTIGQIQDSGTSEILNWTDPSASSHYFIVAINGDGHSHTYSTAAGATSYTFTGLNPSVDYCFTVATYEGENSSHILVDGAPATFCQTSRQ
jgi:serine/threonine protein kinase